MSVYYKPVRKPDWNYGGSKWRLSRSKIALFLECPLCFYIDNKWGHARPPGYPFNLNSAVDALLKKEFDIHRVAKTRHPICEQYGVDAVPFAHSDLNIWRENFKGIQHQHAKTGFTIAGAVDDVWVNPEGELIVVDYKATSKDEKIETLDQDWHDGYKRQMEIYQWLLRQEGFKVSNTGYFVYANANKDREAFDGKLEFEVTLIAHEGQTHWVEPTLVELKKCLDGAAPPAPHADCDYCRYREEVGKTFFAYTPTKIKNEAPAQKPLAKKDDAKTAHLF